jgi:hypothetical protein
MYLPGSEPESHLHEEFEKVLVHPDIFPRPSTGMFRPSEASAVISTKYGPLVVGHCSRATWFRLKGYPPEEALDMPHQIQRMEVGKEVEKEIIEKCKVAGLWAGNNIQFKAVMGGIQIAGELDAVLKRRSDQVKYLLEIKSIYGYYAQKEIFGRFLNQGGDPGKPRDTYVMQVALYLNYFSKLPKDHPMYLPFGAIFVCDRGDGHFGVFDVWLSEEMQVIGEDETINISKISYRSPRMRVPTTVLPYSVEDILARYRMVDGLLPGGTPPKREFSREYDKETIEIRYAQGLVSKSAYEKWQSSHGPRGKGKETLGDFQCSYCPHSSLCWDTYED